MKYFYKIIIFSLTFFIWFSFVYADPTTPDTSSPESLKVTVTEKIYWANCWTWKIKDWLTTYECTVEPWFSSVMSMLWWIIKYFTVIWTLAAVLMIIVKWIQLSMWWLDSWAKEDAKKSITTIIFALVFLLLSWVILSIIAPWVYK